MSYYTFHTLSWDNEDISKKQVTEALAPMMNNPGEAVTNGQMEEVENMIDGSESAKWYDSDQHASRLSLMWPGTLFTMECLGEDSERSISFYRDGLFYTDTPEIPSFSEETFQNTARKA